MTIKADYVFLNLAHELGNHEVFYFFLSQFIEETEDFK